MKTDSVHLAAGEASRTSVEDGDSSLLAQHLREQCAKVRTKSTPLSDLIPLMQQAADSLDAHKRLRVGVRAITSFLKNKEWADLLTTDPDLADLEQEVGKVIGVRA